MSSTGKIRRLLHLLERLQSGRTHHAGELAEFCNVSRRTVFRDLKVLQESGIPILYDASRQGYWIPAHAQLPPAELTLSETLALLVLSQESTPTERRVPFQDAARDAALKLQSNLPSQLAPYAGELLASLQVHGEPIAVAEGHRVHYERLLEAVRQRRKIRMTYQSLYEQQSLQTLVSPYRVLFRRHAWYVIGRSSLHRAVRTFHLGRIAESELTGETYEIPPRFSLKRYLGNAWNLIRERGARTKVVVRFQPLVAKNVAEVAWHPTQKLKWNNDGTLDFSVTVDGYQEMSWWILSYADQACVLEPEPLRQLIRERSERMLRQYKTRRRPHKK